MTTGADTFADTRRDLSASSSTGDAMERSVPGIEPGGPGLLPGRLTTSSSAGSAMERSVPGIMPGGPGLLAGRLTTAVSVQREDDAFTARQDEESWSGARDALDELSPHGQLARSRRILGELREAMASMTPDQVRASRQARMVAALDFDEAAEAVARAERGDVPADAVGSADRGDDSGSIVDSSSDGATDFSTLSCASGSPSRGSGNSARPESLSRGSGSSVGTDGSSLGTLSIANEAQRARLLGMTVKPGFSTLTTVVKASFVSWLRRRVLLTMMLRTASSSACAVVLGLISRHPR